MKRVFCLLVLLGGILVASYAQKSMHLTRSVLVSVPDNEMVKYGEFQIDLHKSVDFRSKEEGYWFPFVYTLKNKYSDACNIMVGENPLIVNRNMVVRTYKIGPSLDKCIFVIKSLEKESNDIGYGMELVRAYGVSQIVCDSILYLDDDGFVYLQGGNSYYSTYRTVYDNQTGKDPVAWLSRKVFDNPSQDYPEEKAAAFDRLEKGAVYFDSPDGNYYYLYRDQYMPNTVLVVNNMVVELHDVYNENDFKLKFSYNGKHWMAVGKECYWMDGVLKSVDGFFISDFMVTNDGHYCYKASKLDAPQEGEVVVIDGQIVRRNAKVCYFSLNGEGKPKIRFATGGRYLQYENEKITDVTTNLVSTYYPDNELNGTEVSVLTNDGTHRLTYREGVPAVMIDGEKIAESTPCAAVYDEWNHSFLWNAIETRGEKTELVLYKFEIVNSIFKNIFNK